jgi:hypothetical protein
VSDTPETDKQAVGVIGWYSCATVPADFARKLERERNEARDTVLRLRKQRAIARIRQRIAELEGVVAA